MTTLDSRCLEAFPGWLRSLAEDARGLSLLLQASDVPSEAQRGAASALNYLFKSLDLIPDGLEDLGFIDDAFVLRVAALQAVAQNPALARQEATTILTKLSTEAELIREFLGDDFARLEKYVQGLADGSARGRSVTQILEDSAARGDFVTEIQQWSESYSPPSFARDARSLVKLKSFLATRLPR